MPDPVSRVMSDEFLFAPGRIAIWFRGVTSPRVCCFVVSVCVAGIARAASFEDRVAALFRPPLGEKMALSPDGQQFAYTRKDGSGLSLVVMGLEPPGAKRTVSLRPAADAEPAAAAAPMELRFLRWATNTRLVFAPVERTVPLPPIADASGRLVPNPDGPTILAPILAMDADGQRRGTLVDARNFQETPADARRTLADLLRTTKELQATRNEPVRWRMPHLDILGFLPGDREQLVIQTRGAYSVPTQHLVDVRTGSVREYGGDWPAPPGEPHVFDWSRLKVVGERRPAARPTTAWRDDELAGVQRELEVKFPRRVVEILDWNETRARVLFRVTGGSDAGRVFVYQRTEDVVLEVLRCAPWLNAAKLHETRFFELAAEDGARLSGYLTWPRQPRDNPPPLLLVFSSGFPGRAHAAFDPEAQLFADLGFAVARLNHRSVAGVRSEDLDALRRAVDRVSVEDARAAFEWLAARQPARAFDRRRVATLGRGFGGYLAVRALQLQPEVFHCGIAIDAPMDLRAWVQRPKAAAGQAGREIPAELIDHAGAEWSQLSAVGAAAALAHPVLLLVQPGRDPAVDVSTEALRAKAQAAGRPIGVRELAADFATASAAARAGVYRQIEEFLNLHLRTDDGRSGPAKEEK